MCKCALGTEDQIPQGASKIDIVGELRPLPFGFGGFKKGMRSKDHEL